MINKPILVVALVFSFLNVFSQFGEQQIITSCKVCGPNNLHYADLDNDGDIDVITTSEFDTQLAWYENKGMGIFEKLHIIDPNLGQVNAIFSADLDEDTDMDIAIVNTVGSRKQIAWYENMGNGEFSSIRSINTSTSSTAFMNTAIYAVDVNKDDRNDLLMIDGNRVRWYANQGRGRFQLTAIKAEPNQFTTNYPTDLDGDGDIDVLTSFRDQLIWYEFEGQTYLDKKIIAENTRKDITGLAAADIDQDGDMDIIELIGADNELVWRVNDGNNQFSSRQIISSETNFDDLLYTTDMDNDGLVDVVTVSKSKESILWYPNKGAGVFEMAQVIADSVVFTDPFLIPNPFYFSDLNNDSYQDVLFFSYKDNRIAWYRQDESNTFQFQSISRPVANNVGDVAAADFDGDGDQDVIGISMNDRKIAWYVNDGQGNFSDEQVIDHLPDIVSEIDIADLDNDGHIDVLSSYNGQIIWYKNDAQGTFTRQPIVEGFDRYISDIELKDLNADGHVDILAAAWLSDELSWFENDGTGNFSERKILDTGVRRINTLIATDFDGDEDLDILALVINLQTRANDQVVLYKNDGTGLFSKSILVQALMEKIFVADLNEDAQLDIISIGAFGNNIFWHQNLGEDTFADPIRINPNSDMTPEAILTDVNKDGYMDVIAYSKIGLLNRIVWYENDGLGVFSTANVITTEVDEVQSLFLEDLDGDNELDLLSGSYLDNKIAWYRNLIPSEITSNRSILSGKSINLYPNPTNDLLYIDLKGVDQQSLRFTLWNSYGQLVKTDFIRDEWSVVSFHNLAKGAYYYKIYAPSGIVQTGKLLKI